ncbi:MAG: hypothetical protein KF771_09335, partial [Burkholderiales bacterium]|nr:hypothetical protein [Burkholderiales bacterium]
PLKQAATARAVAEGLIRRDSEVPVRICSRRTFDLRMAAPVCLCTALPITENFRKLRLISLNSKRLLSEMARFLRAFPGDVVMP